MGKSLRAGRTRVGEEGVCGNSLAHTQEDEAIRRKHTLGKAAKKNLFEAARLDDNVKRRWLIQGGGSVGGATFDKLTQGNTSN